MLLHLFLFLIIYQNYNFINIFNHNIKLSKNNHKIKIRISNEKNSFSNNDEVGSSNDNQNINSSYFECLIGYRENQIKYHVWLLSNESYNIKYNEYPNIYNFIAKYPFYKNNIVSMICNPIDIKINNYFVCLECLKFYRGALFKEGFIIPANNKSLNYDFWPIDECMKINNDKMPQITQIDKLINLPKLGNIHYMQSYCLTNAYYIN